VARQGLPSGSLDRERVDLANRFKVADVGGHDGEHRADKARASAP
jgi:hypothetical protein